MLSPRVHRSSSHVTSLSCPNLCRQGGLGQRDRPGGGPIYAEAYPELAGHRVRREVDVFVLIGIVRIALVVQVRTSVQAVPSELTKAWACLGPPDYGTNYALGCYDIYLSWIGRGIVRNPHVISGLPTDN